MTCFCGEDIASKTFNYMFEHYYTIIHDTHFNTLIQQREKEDTHTSLSY